MADNLDKTLISIQISRLSKWIDRLLDQQLRPHGVRRGQHATLMAIADLNQPSLTQLAARLEIDKAAITRSVSACEQRGWVVTEFAPQNLKTRIVKLTGEGERLIPAIQQALIAVEWQVRKELPEPLVAALHSVQSQKPE